jgi:tight adherence protein B
MMDTPVMLWMGTGIFFMGLMLFFYVNISAMMKQFRIMQERYLIGMESKVEQFKYFMNTQKEIPALNLSLALLFGLAGINLQIGIFGVLFGALAGWFAPMAVKNYLRAKRMQKLNIQFVQAMGLMANGMKAGESLIQAIEATRRIMSNPMAQELSIISGQVRLGVPVQRALEEFGQRVPLSDVQIATSAMLISIKTGADLPAAFQQITETIRNRMTVQGKINALTVQGKAQGLVASIVPFALGGVFYIMDPEYISIYFKTFLGNCVVAFVIVMQIVAFFVIRKIVSINI